MKPDWFVLMQEWTRQGHGARGVTVPFLVGAIGLQNRNLQPSRENAREILSEMIANPVENYSTDIGWCSTLGAPVLSAMSSPSPAASKVGFLRPGKNELCVIFGEDLQRHWNLGDAQSLLNELIDDACEANLEGKFSRDAHSKSYRELNLGKYALSKRQSLSNHSSQLVFL